MAECLNLAVPDLVLVAEDAVLLLGDELAVEHLGSRDTPKLADVVNRLDLGMAEDNLLVLRRQQVEHRVLDMVDELVDDAEGVDAHAVMTGLLLDARVVSNVEADNDRLARRGGLDVGERDVARAHANDVEADLFGLDLVQRLHDCLQGTLRVGLDNRVQLALTLGRHRAHERVQRRRLRSRKRLFLLLLRGLLGERARTLLIQHHAELGSRLRNAAQARALHGRRRRRLLDAAAVVVDERANLAEVLADEDRVADLERAARDEERRARPETLLQLRFDHEAVRAAVRVRLKLKDLRLHENVLEKRVHALTRHAAHRAADDVAAPVFRRQALLLKLLLDAVDVRRRLVGLGDRHHDLDARLPTDLDTLLGLRHDAVVGRHNEDGDVGNLGAAGAHRAERSVPRGVEKGDLLARELDLVGRDLLGDAARLASSDMLLADPVHQRRLAVVDVTEERDDRRTRLQRLGRILGNEIVRIDRLEDRLRRRLVAGMLDLHLVAVLLRNLGRDVRLDALIDGREDLEAHQVRDQAVRLDVQLRREVLHNHGAANRDFLRFGVHRDVTALLRHRRRHARHALVKALLPLAVLLALAVAALEIVVVARRLRRTRLRRRRDGNRNRRSRLRVGERLEPGGRGKPRRRRRHSWQRLRLVAGRHTDHRFRWSWSRRRRRKPNSGICTIHLFDFDLGLQLLPFRRGLRNLQMLLKLRLLLGKELRVELGRLGDLRRALRLCGGTVRALQRLAERPGLAVAHQADRA